MEGGGVRWAQLVEARGGAAGGREAPGGRLPRFAGDCCFTGEGWGGRHSLAPPAPVMASEKALEAWHVPGSVGAPLEPILWLKWRDEGQLVSLCVSYVLEGRWCHMLVACQGAQNWVPGASVARISVDAEFVELASAVHTRFVPTIRRILNEGAAFKNFSCDAKLWRVQASCLMRSDVEAELDKLRKANNWGIGWGVAAVKEGLLLSWGDHSSIIISVAFYPHAKLVRVVHLEEEGERYGETLDTLQELLSNVTGKIEVARRLPLTGLQSFAVRGEDAINKEKILNAVDDLYCDDNLRQEKRMRKLVQRTKGIPLKTLALNRKILAWANSGILRGILHLIAHGRFDNGNFEGVDAATAVEVCVTFAKLAEGSPLAMQEAAATVLQFLKMQSEVSLTLVEVLDQLARLESFAAAAGEVGISDSILDYYASHLQPGHSLFHYFQAAHERAQVELRNKPPSSPAGISPPREEQGLKNSTSFNFGPATPDNEAINKSPRVEMWPVLSLKKQGGDNQGSSMPKPLVPRLRIPIATSSSTPALTRSTRRSSVQGAGTDRSSAGNTGRGFSSRMLSPASSQPSSRKGELSFRTHCSTDYKELCSMIGKGLVLTDISAIFHLRDMSTPIQISADVGPARTIPDELPQKLQRIAASLKPEGNAFKKEGHNVAAAMFLKPPSKFIARNINPAEVLSSLKVTKRSSGGKSGLSLRRHASFLQRGRARLLEIVNGKKPEGDALVDLENVTNFLSAGLASTPELVGEVLDSLGEALLELKSIISGFGSPNLWRRSHVMVMLSTMKLFTEILKNSRTRTQHHIGCSLAFQSPGKIWGIDFLRSVFSAGRVHHEIGSKFVPGMQTSCLDYLNEVVLLNAKLMSPRRACDISAPSHLLKEFSSNSRNAIMSLTFVMDVRRGFIPELLSEVNLADSSVLHVSALRLLTNIFTLRPCPILEDHSMTDFYIITAFTNFVRLYRYDGARKTMHSLTGVYLELLSALACNKTPEMSRRFQRLKFADLIIGEMSLEFHGAKLASSLTAAVDNPSMLNGNLQAQTGPKGVPRLNMSILKNVSGEKLAAQSNTKNGTLKGDDNALREQNDSPKDDAQSKMLHLAEARCSIEFTGDLEEDVELLESIEDQADGGQVVPAGCPENTIAVGVAAHSQNTPGMGVRVPILNLPPRRLSASHEETVTSQKTMKEQRPPQLQKLKFTGDLEEDVAMLEEIEEVRREEHTASSPLRAGGLPAESDPKINSSNENLKVPKLNIALLGSSADKGDLEKGVSACKTKMDTSEEYGDDGTHIVPHLLILAESPKLRHMDGRAKDTNLERQGSGLAALQESMQTMNAKAQLTIMQPDKRNALLRKQQSEFHKEGSLSEHDYMRRRSLHKIYHDAAFHICMVETLLGLLLTRDGDLEKYVYELYPLEHKMPNFFFLLALHLNHISNQAVSVGLIQKIQQKEGPLWNAMQQLLRLLIDGPFFGNAYSATTKIARGAYADVHRCRMPEDFHPDTVIVKAIDLPDSIYDANVIPDVFSEVSIMQKLSTTSCACRLHDYGIHKNRIYLILKNYPLSLRAWRATHGELSEGSVRLYLNIFINVIRACEILAHNNTVHYDIKGDNILIDPHNGTSFKDILSPPTEQPPFSVVLADFGESKYFSDPGKPYSVRNRGTECIKSPEMLTVSNATKKSAESYDRRRPVGVGKPADVWAVGCLLYELMTGDYLLHDPDWIRFFIRVTTEKENLLPPEKMEAIASFPEIKDLLLFILVRNPQRRPTMQDVRARADRILTNNFKNISHARTMVTLQPRSEIADYTKTSPLAPDLESVFPNDVRMPPSQGTFKVSSWLSVVMIGNTSALGSDSGTTVALVQTTPQREYRPKKDTDLCPKLVYIKYDDNFEEVLESVVCIARDSCRGFPPASLDVDFRIASTPGLEAVAWRAAMGLLLILEQDDLSTASKKLASACATMPLTGEQVRSLLDFRRRMLFSPCDEGSQVFSCPCGSWQASVKRKYLSDQFICDCSDGEASQCPCGSCTDLIEGLNFLHGCNMSVLVWDHTDMEYLKPLPLSRSVEMSRPGGGQMRKTFHVCSACWGVTYIQHGQKVWLLGNLDYKKSNRYTAVTHKN